MSQMLTKRIMRRLHAVKPNSRAQNVWRLLVWVGMQQRQTESLYQPTWKWHACTSGLAS